MTTARTGKNVHTSSCTPTQSPTKLAAVATGTVEHAGVDVPVQVVRPLRPATPHLGVAPAPPPVALEPPVPHRHAFRLGLRGQRGVRRPGDGLVPSPLDVGRRLVGAGRVGGHDAAAAVVGLLEREEGVPEGRAQRLAHEGGVRLPVGGGEGRITLRGRRGNCGCRECGGGGRDWRPRLVTTKIALPGVLVL